MTTATKPKSDSEAKPDKDSDEREIFERSLFSQVLAALAGRGVPAAEAIELAKDYAEAGVEVYF